MSAATLGGLIKDHRIRKRLSQLEVSLRIGWKDTTRLSKIEQGRVGTPTRATVDKIIDALGLEGPEKGEFLLVGGYLPTEEEIEEIREKTAPMLNSWTYPALVYDFSWRIISDNQIARELYQINHKMSDVIKANNFRILDLIYDPDLAQNKLLTGDDLKVWQETVCSVTAHFKHEQRNRVKDKWFVNYVKKMSNNVLFRKCWKENSIQGIPNAVIGKFVTKALVNPKDLRSMLNFYLFAVPIIDDPRFEMEVLVPSNLSTYNFLTQGPK